MPRKTPIQHLREICLALPEATEQVFGGHTSATFRVRDKIFAMKSDHQGRKAFTCKAPPGAQHILTGSDPKRFFVPPYVGPKGWIGVRIDGAVDWELIADLVTDSYRMTAPSGCQHSSPSATKSKPLVARNAHPPMADSSSQAPLPAQRRGRGIGQTPAFRADPSI